MKTYKLSPAEAIKKASSLIDNKEGFDFFSKKSQYIYNEMTEDFHRVNLWSENGSDYKCKEDFISQLKRSSKSETEIEINVYPNFSI
tara:strand:- start:173 stop:433 length:261 start_codon:yes stop_codon:yes gene_type:complete